MRLCLLALLISVSSFAQRTWEMPVKKVISADQNQPLDLMLTDSGWEAHFVHSNGQILDLKSFAFDGKQSCIRFNPEQAGEYTYEIRRIGQSKSFAKGSISVKASERKALVQVDPKRPQKFQYQDGKPYFALAFELDWLFALDYPFSDSLPQSKQLLHVVKENGFNQVVMNAFAYQVGWPSDSVPARYQFEKPKEGPFKGGNENPHFDQLNYAFFKNLDRKIQLLHEEGLAAHLMIYVWNKKVRWPEMYSKEDNAFFDYVIQRYQGYPNIIWDVSKEALDYGRCDIPYINERIERIRKNDAYKHLVTVHDYEYCRQEPDRVDFISIQNWRSDLYSNSIDAGLLHADKPLMNIEHGGYEKGPYQSFVGNYMDPITCLERNYQAIFAGVYSSYYWQNTSWNIVIYDIMSADYPKPHFAYYRHLQELFTRYSFQDLKPQKQKLTINSKIGADNYGTSAYPLTNGKGRYLYFVPKENDFVNTVLPKPASGRFQVSFFNILTGEYQRHEEAYQLFKGYTSPWKGQAYVLIVEEIPAN